MKIGQNFSEVRTVTSGTPVAKRKHDPDKITIYTAIGSGG